MPDLHGRVCAYGSPRSRPLGTLRYTHRGRIACCARAVHKVCIVPYPNCIVVPRINDNEPREYRVQSPSPPPSPSQPGHSLLASLEAKQRDLLPSQQSNTPSVSQPRAASWPAQSASTASSPSLPVQQTSYSPSAPGLGHSRSRGKAPSRSTSKLRPKRGRAPKATAHSRQNEKERNITVPPICPSVALEGHWRHLDWFRP